MLGGANTTVNPLYTAHELAHQLTDSGASYLLTIPMFLEAAQAAATEAGGIKEIFVLGEAEGATPFAELLKSDGFAFFGTFASNSGPIPILDSAKRGVASTLRDRDVA